MQKEGIDIIYYKRSKLLLVWSIVELIFLVLLFLVSYWFLFSCSKIVPRGPPSFQLKIQSDTIFAKNAFQLIQQGLKFATYLSNDLNIYMNKTISETYLQRLDSVYDDTLYQFNVFGFCRRNELTKIKNCYNGDGINVVTSFIQDLGMQLGNLTNQNDPKVVSARLVVLFYDIIKHVCTNDKNEICVLQTYNCISKAVRCLGILTLVNSGIACLVSFLELVYYCFRGVTTNRVPFYIKMVAVCFEILAVNAIYCIIYALQGPLSNLVAQYKIGKLDFAVINWIIWCFFTLICLFIIIKRYRIYQSI